MPSTITNLSTSPTTTKGDIEVNNGSGIIRLPIGTNDQVLTADSTEASGVKWADAGGGGGGEWTEVSSLTWSAETTKKSFSSLSGAGKMFKIVYKMLNVASAGGKIQLQLNGETGAEYNFNRIEGATVGSVSNQTQMTIAEVTGSGSFPSLRMFGEVIIDGDVDDTASNDVLYVAGGFNGNKNRQNFLSGYLQAGSGTTAITAIDIFGSANMTGKVTLYERTFGFS